MRATVAVSDRLGMWLVVVLCAAGLSRGQEHLDNVENEKVCQGTSHGLVARGDPDFRYTQYKNEYTNCTYLVGNLEIIFLDKAGETFDLSFLSTIKQVTGYVLILGVHADYVPLTSLQIIRGKTLFHYSRSKDDYSLFVALNYDKTNKSIGLKELRFKSLSEILAGKVFFMNNNQLCFENTVNWKDINPSVQPPVEFRFNSTDHRRNCLEEECDPSCFSNITKERHCWGAGPDMCQRLSQGEACHPSCERRCYGKLPNQCCHQECAGGCSGPKKTDCLACRNFLDDGACVPYCPPEIIYDSRLMMNVPNPNAKYAYGGICVKECPGYLLQDAGSCVRACPEGKHAKDGKNCEPCEGPCPRTCKGTEGSEFLNAANLNNFTDCTTIDGNLRILKHSFLEDQYYNISPLHPDNLTVLEHVREITGFLLIQSDHENFTDLSFLKSLEVIHGRQLDSGQALQILGTPLRSLGLTSLKSIRNGNVYILANQQLCYADTIDWNKLFLHPRQKYQVFSNRPKDECQRDGEVCDSQCDDSGCWGPGPNKCLKCKLYEFQEEHLCLPSCSNRPLLYHAGEGKCKRCHKECNNSCTGPENTACDACASVAIHGPDGQVKCFAECPPSTYPDESKVCRPCHEYCKKIGCTGPQAVVGPGGCNSCEVGIRKNRTETTVTCLPPDTDHCEDGYHKATISSSSSGPMAGRTVCEPCHPFCTTCSGPGMTYCTSCKFYRGLDGLCIDFCPQYAYSDKTTRECIKCHQECRGGCSGGSSSAHCKACTNFKIYLDEDFKHFNCTAKCPESLPYQVRDVGAEDENRNVCADQSHPDVQAMLADEKAEEKKKIIIIVVPIISGVLLLALLLTLFGYYWQRRAKAKEKTAELTARMTGYDETEPVTPTNAQPDLAKLRLIKESELRKGGIIGSGAFGTVYKGFWIPENENVKIPVAIKVLQDGTSNQNKELLEEARVMASVEHACCIRILAVCMSAQMMLITQLMPLGCLLDYVRKNKEHIGSKVLLNWCTQIARGMSYLEERGIVHRDLAARNVLVQTPTQVKITDFGLAKLLDYNEDEYHAAGGKMPIKWLALECIQHRIFTHKSDVWSFGVTAWELFTYGQKPYDNIRARDVPGLLEKGERLPQPSICTIDVYMIMIKCWMLDAESRPSFKELAEEFAKMARDPGRYLVVQGDKLMRLPSHSYDKTDLVRSVSVADNGPEEIMEADDYLQPQEPPLSSPHIFENNNSSTPLLQAGACVYPTKLEKSEATGPPWRERNYAHLNAAVEARKQRQQSPTRGREDSFNSRYSSDPIKCLRDRAYPGASPAHSHNGLLVPSPRCLAPIKVLQLPVDEDNYLAPHSTTSTPAMYTDLSDKGYYQNEKVFEEEPEADETACMLRPTRSYPTHLQPKGMPAVTNPEYFEHDDDVWETKPMPNGLHHIQPVVFNGQPHHSSPHPPDYYNDLSDVTVTDRPGGSSTESTLTFRTQLPSESQV